LVEKPYRKINNKAINKKGGLNTNLMVDVKARPTGAEREQEMI